MTIRIPSALHEVLGEHQSIAALGAIAASGLGFALLWGPGILQGAEVAFWRRALAFLLLIDIAAGAVANLSAGTNAFYAQRPRHRWGFILLHVHLPLFGALLGLPLGPFVAVWAYTICAAVVLTLLISHPSQRILAGGLLVFGLGALPVLLPDPLSLAVSALFLFKVAYSFAVDHQRVLPHG